MLISQFNFLFPDIDGSLASIQLIEFMPERRHVAMQSSGKSPLEMHRPWGMDVLGLLKKKEEPCRR
jgi:hypothetical protein